jgi:hypothetical protein
MWLQKMVELFFQQLSPQIYTTLSKKLLHFVTYNVVPNATKEVSPKLSRSFPLLNPVISYFLYTVWIPGGVSQSGQSRGSAENLSAPLLQEDNQAQQGGWRRYWWLPC